MSLKDKLFGTDMVQVLSECGRTGIYHGSIRRCAIGQLKTAGGCRWEYVEDVDAKRT